MSQQQRYSAHQRIGQFWRKMRASESLESARFVFGWIHRVLRDFVWLDLPTILVEWVPKIDSIWIHRFACEYSWLVMWLE